MNKQLLKDTFIWGFLLWLIGYVLGLGLFFIAPPDLIGWVIMPLEIIFTLWVLWKKINNQTFSYYLLLSLAWTILAIVLDYFLIVKTLKPTDGYYKLDVYLYYAFTFVLPLIVGLIKKPNSTQS